MGTFCQTPRTSRSDHPNGGRRHTLTKHNNCRLSVDAATYLKASSTIPLISNVLSGACARNSRHEGDGMALSHAQP